MQTIEKINFSVQIPTFPTSYALRIVFTLHKAEGLHCKLLLTAGHVSVVLCGCHVINTGRYIDKFIIQFAVTADPNLIKLIDYHLPSSRNLEFPSLSTWNARTLLCSP